MNPTFAMVLRRMEYPAVEVIFWMQGGTEMDTFLPPIETPDGFMMKLVYYFTPPAIRQSAYTIEGVLRAVAAAFGMFYGKINKLDKKLLLPPETAF